MVVAQHFQDVEAKPMVDGVTMRLVIGPEQNAPYFNMRIFDVEPGAATPHHKHWWEHEVFILHGKGILKTGNSDLLISEGMAIFIPGNEMHQFVNSGQDLMRFMCLVPQDWLENISLDPSKDPCC